MAARKSMPREGVEMKDRFEAFVVQGTNESFATTDNHMLFMSPIVNSPIVNSMDNGLTSTNWSSVDYSVLRGNAGATTVPVQLIDSAASLNYIQQPAVQSLSNTHQSQLIPHSTNAQVHSLQQQQQQQQQQTQQPQQTNSTSVVQVSSNPHIQQAIGQLVPTVVQSHNNTTVNLHPHVLLTNQHVSSNMWQSNAPPHVPPQAQASLLVGHVHQQHTQPPQTVTLTQQQQQPQYVNVGVQAGGVDADGNHTLDPMPDNQQTYNSKLPAKKRLRNMTQAASGSGLFTSNVPPKKRSKMTNDKKSSKANNTTVDGGKVKKKRTVRKKKHNSNPNQWKKNLRKLSRVQGQAYINSRGKLVPAKTRSGPPCNCRMRCYDRILEDECNEIFQRFLQIADKDIQDALLYSLITKEEVKHRKSHKVCKEGTDQQDSVECGESPEGRHNVRNATFLYHVQCQEGILRVCSSAFSSIYGATQKRIRRLQQHKFKDPLNPPTDLRGKHGHQKDMTGGKLDGSPGKISGIKQRSQEETDQKKIRANLVSEGIAFCVNKLSHPHGNTTVNSSSNNKPVDYSVVSNQQALLTPQHHHQLSDQAIQESGAIEASNFLGGFLLGASGAGEMKILQNFPADATVDSSGLVNKNLTGISLQDTLQQAVGELDEKEDKDCKAGRSRHPELWKKNIRKKNRAHGMAYINTKGKLVPAKSRSGPPCHCRMRCYLRINEEQCNKIFGEFHKIGDKNVQDGLLYNLMIHKEVKKKKQRGTEGLVDGLTEEGMEHGHGEECKDKPVYQGDLLDFFLGDKDSAQANEMQDKFVQNLVSGGMGDLSDGSASHRDDDGGFTGIINLSTRNIATSGVSGNNNPGISFRTNTNCEEPQQQAYSTDERAGDVYSLNSDKKQLCVVQKSRDRQSTFWYYVQLNSGLVRVCSTAFMSIYGATQKRVRRLQQHKVVNPITPPKDMRGKHGNSNMPQPVVQQQQQQVKPKRSKGKSSTTGSKRRQPINSGSNILSSSSNSNDKQDNNITEAILTDIHQQQIHLNQQVLPAQQQQVIHNGIIMVSSDHVRPPHNVPATQPQPGIFMPSEEGLQAMNLVGQNQIWQNTIQLQPQQALHGNQSDLHL